MSSRPLWCGAAACMHHRAHLHAVSCCRTSHYAARSGDARADGGGPRGTCACHATCVHALPYIVRACHATYVQVTFKPMAAGKCTIYVSLYGEPLPGSPVSCLVSAPFPCASQCILRGDALSSIVACTRQSFTITFCNAAGALAHACELDVWVHRAGDDDEPGGGAYSGGEGVSTLLRPLSRFESLVVGSAPLDVSATRDEQSDWIGRVQAGRRLKVVKIEKPAREGGAVRRRLRMPSSQQISSDRPCLAPLASAHSAFALRQVRACILLEAEDREHPISPTWRELWPSVQPWRTSSWRAHIEEEKAVAEQARPPPHPPHLPCPAPASLQPRLLSPAAAFRPDVMPSPSPRPASPSQP